MRFAFVAGAFARGLHLSPERVLVQVVVLGEARQVVAGGRAQHPPRQPLARERTVHAAERLDADEIAEREHVQRDLQTKIAVDVARRMRAFARLVVLDDPARRERVDVDPVDLPREAQPVAEIEPALKLGCGALGPERDLESARHERHLRRRFVTEKPLEIRDERLAELRRLELGQIEPDSRFERVVQAGSHEDERGVEVLGRHALGVQLPGKRRVEAVQRRVNDLPSEHRVRLGVDGLGIDHALHEPGRGAVGETLELGRREHRLARHRLENGGAA